MSSRRRSTPRTTIERRAARQAATIRAELAAELRRAREDAGLSLERLARAARVSKSYLHAIESGAAEPRHEVLARVATALGMSLSVRLYPGTGPLVRDHIQAAMVDALIEILDDRWRPRPEVAVHRPVRGVIDLVLEEDVEGLIVACEAQSELRRLEQQVRWQAAKADALRERWAPPARDGRQGRDGLGPHRRDGLTPDRGVGRLLLLRSTARTRAIVAEHAALMEAAYPSPAADLYAALVGDEPWPGDGLLWCRVQQGRAEILTGPPRGIRVGRRS